MDKQALYDATWSLVIQRADLAIGVVTFNGSKLADELIPKDEKCDVIQEKSRQQKAPDAAE